MSAPYKCLVCGWAGLTFEPIFPFSSQEICACCGVQYGLDIQDINADVIAAREEWLSSGALWFDDEVDVFPRKPNDWDEKVALNQIASLNNCK